MPPWASMCLLGLLASQIIVITPAFVPCDNYYRNGTSEAGKYQLPAKHLLATDHSSSTHLNTECHTSSCVSHTLDGLSKKQTPSTCQAEGRPGSGGPTGRGGGVPRKGWPGIRCARPSFKAFGCGMLRNLEESLSRATRRAWLRMPCAMPGAGSRTGFSSAHLRTDQSAGAKCCYIYSACSLVCQAEVSARAGSKEFSC